MANDRAESAGVAASVIVADGGSASTARMRTLGAVGRRPMPALSPDARCWRRRPKPRCASSFASVGMTEDAEDTAVFLVEAPSNMIQDSTLLEMHGSVQTAE